jgi:hypothetical protein
MLNGKMIQVIDSPIMTFSICAGRRKCSADSFGWQESDLTCKFAMNAIPRVQLHYRLRVCKKMMEPLAHPTPENRRAADKCFPSPVSGGLIVI